MTATSVGLSLERRVALKGFAQNWILGAMLFSGLAIALQKPLTAAFPGTTGDRVMFALTLVAVYSLVGTLFKLFVVKWLGPKLEQRVGMEREVRLRDVFQKGVRSTAIWGGTLQVFHSVLFVALIEYISPAGLAAARACVVIPLAVVELVAGVMVATGRGWYARLAGSLAMTLAGALLVVFAGGTKGLFKESGMVPMVLFLALLTVGNLGLAIAEYQEYKGVHHKVAAAPVYTLARFVAYTATALAAVAGWGFINGRFDVMLAVLNMCWERWYFIVGIAFFWAITDLSRICVKTIVSATYMYVVMALAIMVDVLAQVGLHIWKPHIYDNVHADLNHVLWALAGAVIVLLGMRLYPPPTHTRADLQTE